MICLGSQVLGVVEAPTHSQRLHRADLLAAPLLLRRHRARVELVDVGLLLQEARTETHLLLPLPVRQRTAQTQVRPLAPLLALPPLLGLLPLLPLLPLPALLGLLHLLLAGRGSLGDLALELAGHPDAVVVETPAPCRAA